MNTDTLVCRTLSLLLFAFTVLTISSCAPVSTPTAIPQSVTVTATRTPTRVPTPTRPPNTPTSTPTSTATPSPVVGTVTDVLRVRGGPNTDSPILARLDPGTTLTFLARSFDGKWLVIAYPPGSNQVAWVSSDIINVVGSTNDLPVAQNTATPTIAPASAPIVAQVTPTVAPPDSAIEFLNRANFVREANNLAPYKWSSLLAASAKHHSEDMARTGIVDSTGSDNSTPEQRIDDAGYSTEQAGENVYGGTGSIDDIWTYWFEDATSQANVLSPNFTEMGIGIVEGAGKTYYTIDFASPALATKTRTPTPTIPVADPCSPISGQEYGILQLMSGATERPAELHSDLNLGLRGYVATNASRALVDFESANNLGVPQLRGLFVNKRLPVILRAYQVNGWEWSGNVKGPPIDNPVVSMLGLQTTIGEPLSTPRTGVDIGDGYAAMVLYASANRITLKYTREDHVSNGYTVYVENVCVEPTLLALYQKSDGPKRNYLPALRAGQPIGRATGSEIMIAVRNKGNFADPRSRRDWWTGQ